MKRNRLFFAAALCASACLGNTEAPSFETYQPILDRMPFGSPPDISVTNGMSAAEAAKEKLKQDQLAKQINMSALTIMPDGRTAIGFTDLSVKPPASYYLAVGEAVGGWEVLEADYDEDTATILKDGVSITLKLGKGLAAPAPLGPPGARAAADAALAAAAQVNAQPRTATDLPPGLRRIGPPSVGATSAVQPVPRPPAATASTSYKDRLDKRVETELAKKEAEDLRQQEQLKRLAEAAAKDAMRRQQEEAAEQEDADLPNVAFDEDAQ